MCGNIVCLAAALLGVEARWPPLPDGGLQYVIQIEPHALDRGESGANEAVRSYVPSYLKDVRAYQIVIGTQRLAKNVPTPNVRSPILAGVDTAWVPLPTGGVECRVWIHPEALDDLEKPGRVIEGKIPAGVKKPSVFMITVGTKPPAESPPTPPHQAERSDSGPPPSIGPLLSDPPSTPKVETVPNAVPSPPTSEAAPPPVPSDPSAFRPDAEAKPLPVQPANHLERSETPADERPPAKADLSPMAKKESSPHEPDKPWLPPTVTLVGLFASLGGNIFLLWIMRDSRSRYRALLRRMGEVGDVVRSCVQELERVG